MNIELINIAGSKYKAVEMPVFTLCVDESIEISGLAPSILENTEISLAIGQDYDQKTGVLYYKDSGFSVISNNILSFKILLNTQEMYDFIGAEEVKSLICELTFKQSQNSLVEKSCIQFMIKVRGRVLNVDTEGEDIATPSIFSRVVLALDEIETNKNIALNSANISTEEANKASGSAISASESASSATNNASIASNSATIATAKASEASASAVTATAKANEASTSAVNANNSATTAITKADEANTSATSASENASIATEKASEATSKANEAKASATTAQNALTNIETGLLSKVPIETTGVQRLRSKNGLYSRELRFEYFSKAIVFESNINGVTDLDTVVLQSQIPDYHPFYLRKVQTLTQGSMGYVEFPSNGVYNASLYEASISVDATINIPDNRTMPTGYIWATTLEITATADCTLSVMVYGGLTIKPTNTPVTQLTAGQVMNLYIYQKGTRCYITYGEVIS